MRRMDGKCLVFRILGCRSFQASDVGSVSKFCLRIAANVLVTWSRLKEELMLGGRSLLLQSLQEHGSMKSIRSWLAKQLIGNFVLFLTPFVLNVESLQSLGSCESSFESLFSASEVVLRLVKDGIRLEDLKNSGVSGENLLCEEEVGQLIDIQRGLGSLLLKEL